MITFSQWMNNNKAKKSIFNQIEEKKRDLCLDLRDAERVNIDGWIKKFFSFLIPIEGLVALTAGKNEDASHSRALRGSLEEQMTTKLAAADQVVDKLSLIHSMLIALSQNISFDGSNNQMYPTGLFKAVEKQFQSLADEFADFTNQHSDRAVSCTRFKTS